MKPGRSQFGASDSCLCSSGSSDIHLEGSSVGVQRPRVEQELGLSFPSVSAGADWKRMGNVPLSQCVCLGENVQTWLRSFLVFFPAGSAFLPWLFIFPLSITEQFKEHFIQRVFGGGLSCLPAFWNFGSSQEGFAGNKRGQLHVYSFTPNF